MSCCPKESAQSDRQKLTTNSRKQRIPSEPTQVGLSSSARLHYLSSLNFYLVTTKLWIYRPSLAPNTGEYQQVSRRNDLFRRKIFEHRTTSISNENRWMKIRALETDKAPGYGNLQVCGLNQSTLDTTGYSEMARDPIITFWFGIRIEAKLIL